jgi:hypothetical protein
MLILLQTIYRARTPFLDKLQRLFLSLLTGLL